MSNAFDKASLVMLPHAYEEGKLYSLKPTDRSGDFTFSRGADTATRVNEQGYIEVVTDLNAPRLDYSGGATCPSLLLEPQRTNLVKQSEYFGSYSYVTRITRQENYGTSPGGLTNSTAIFNSALYGAHNIAADAVSFTSGTTYTFSVFVKAGTLSKIQLSIINAISTKVDFDLLAGTATGTGASIENYGNGWYRCVYTIAATSTTTNGRAWVGLLNNDGASNYLGSTSEYIELYGFQVEEASYPTSYIPTNGSTQTRPADSFNIPSSANLSIPSNSWTIFWDVSDESVADGGRWFDDNEQNIQLYPTASSKSRVYWRGIGQYIASGGGSKIIARFDGTTATEFHDGTNKGSASYSGQLPFDFYTTLGVGSGKYIFNKFIIFPTALSDDECIALTTL